MICCPLLGKGPLITLQKSWDQTTSALTNLWPNCLHQVQHKQISWTYGLAFALTLSGLVWYHRQPAPVEWSGRLFWLMVWAQDYWWKRAWGNTICHQKSIGPNEWSPQSDWRRLAGLFKGWMIELLPISPFVYRALQRQGSKSSWQALGQLTSHLTMRWLSGPPFFNPFQSYGWSIVHVSVVIWYGISCVCRLHRILMECLSLYDANYGYWLFSHDIYPSTTLRVCASNSWAFVWVLILQSCADSLHQSLLGQNSRTNQSKPESGWNRRVAPTTCDSDCWNNYSYSIFPACAYFSLWAIYDVLLIVY